MRLNIKLWQEKIHEWASEKGWWNEDRNIGELLALVHSEVSEALEDWRDGKMKTYLDQGPDTRQAYVDDNPKPCGFPSELADVVIRVLDIAEYLGIDIEKEMEIKMKYNETRAYRHGGKKA